MRSVKPPIRADAVNRVPYSGRCPRPTVCPNCGRKVRLVNHSLVYGREYGDWPYIYLCETKCSYVGTHPGTDIPLGTLADQETRDWRKKAKDVFNSLWRGKRTPFSKRGEAYKWLAGEMDIPAQECHFGWFDVDRCKLAHEICWRRAR